METLIGNSQAKKERRNSRLIRLYILSEAYNRYQMFYLNQCVLKHSSNYDLAENTSMLINTIFKGETKPVDFLKDENQASNDLIDSHKEYQNFLNKTYLDKAVVDAFCKASEHNFGSILKINSIPFTRQIGLLTLYNVGEINKEQLQEALTDFCIFTKKTKKLNTKLLKKTVHSIEKLYTEILNKKIARTIKTISL